MLEQLLLDSSYFERVFLFMVVIALAALAAIAIGYGLNAFFIDHDIFLGIVTIVVAIIGISGTYVFITQLDKQATEIKTILKGHVENYYTLTKDGKAITLKLKNSKSEYLEKEAEAKIIDEDNKTYQIQYKDTIDRVPKSAVK
jgi:hypothetical protein